MMSKVEEIKNYLEKRDYHKRNNIASDKSIYYRYVNGQISIIALYSNYNAKEMTRNEIQEELEDIAKRENTDISRIMIVAMGYGKPETPSYRGFLYLDCLTDKIYGKSQNSNMLIDTKEVTRFKDLRNLEIKEYRLSLGNIRYPNDDTLIYILIFINVLIFMNSRLTNANAFVLDAGKVLLNSESYRLLTYMFIHASLTHIIANMTMLLMIGKSLSQRIGPVLTFVIYLSSGILGGLLSCYHKLAFSETAPTVGASAAIFGLLGAYLVDVIMDQGLIGWNTKRTLKKAVLFLILSSTGLNVDGISHIGGFIGGMVVMYILNRYIDKDIKNQRNKIRKILKGNNDI